MGRWGRVRREGRYDRAWGNTLELSVDAQSKVRHTTPPDPAPSAPSTSRRPGSTLTRVCCWVQVEGVVASSFIRATAAPAEAAPPPKLPPAGDVPLEPAADKEL